MKKFNPKIMSLVGICSAIIAGVSAFIGSIEDQKREQRIDEMDERIKLLENNNGD